MSFRKGRSVTLNSTAATDKSHPPVPLGSNALSRAPDTLRCLTTRTPRHVKNTSPACKSSASGILSKNEIRTGGAVGIGTAAFNENRLTDKHQRRHRNRRY